MNGVASRSLSNNEYAFVIGTGCQSIYGSYVYVLDLCTYKTKHLMYLRAVEIHHGCSTTAHMLWGDPSASKGRESRGTGDESLAYISRR